MGRPAQISREAVLAAGLAIADAEGLEAVTMQGVALRLGVTPMALYRHVADKADLLDGLVERLLGEVATGASDGSWEERLRRLGRSVRGVARRHPNVFPLLLQRPATTPAALAVRDQVCGALVEGGLGVEQAQRAERLISTAILGFAASEAAGRFRGHSRRVIDGDFACLEDAIGAALRGAARDAHGGGARSSR